LPRKPQALAPRRALWLLANGFLGLTAVWSLISVIDLHDGSAWADRRVAGGARIWERVTARERPGEFKTVVMLRGAMPAILLGTIGAVSLIGALAQPKELEP
jgi:hypothetical protein